MLVKSLVVVCLVLAGCTAAPTADPAPQADLPDTERGQVSGVLLAPLIIIEHEFRVASAGHEILRISGEAAQPPHTVGLLVYVDIQVVGPEGEASGFRIGPTTSVAGPVAGEMAIPTPTAGVWHLDVQIWPRGLPVTYAVEWCAGDEIRCAGS